MGRFDRVRAAVSILVLAVVAALAAADVMAAPRLVVFAKSPDHDTLVISYRLDVFPDGADPGTATAVARSDLGKPTPAANGDITVDRAAFFNSLPPGSYVATVSAVGANGERRGAAVTFTSSGPPPPPTATLTAAPASIVSGQSATLSWNSSAATAVTINQGIGTVAPSGTRTVSPGATTTYAITATNSIGSMTATAVVTVARATPTISWTPPAAIIYGTALGAAQLNATTDVPGTMTYSPAAGTVLAAGAQTLSVTFTPNDTAGYNPATRAVSIAVTKATPIITWPAPAAIRSGTALGATQLNATASVAGTFAYSPASGTVLPEGSAQRLSVAFTPAAAANHNPATASVSITVTAATPTAGHDAARANAYDDGWQDGATGWVANARAILAGGTGQTPGLVFWIGDSLTGDPALGAWAQRGAGKTVEDQAITTWMHAGLSVQGLDSVDGFALATPYMCAGRSYTAGEGLGAPDLMGNAMLPDTNPGTARLTLQDCATYPNALNLFTMLAALRPGQFAILQMNLVAGNPGVFTDLERMVDLLIANHVVPIVVTYTYSTDAAVTAQVDSYNAALVQYARSKKLPLIDLNQEMLARLPLAQWPGRFLAGGRYTSGTSQFPSTSDPYASGGDPATHTTGLALTYDGYGLKGWLGVQKMKEIKQLVIDAATPTLSSVTTSTVTSSSAIVTWTTDVPASSRVDYGPTSAYGASAVDASLAAGHSVSLTGLTASTPYHYKVTSQASTGAPASTADLVFTTAAPALTISNTGASNVTGSSATVSWSTNVASSSRIDYGPTTAYGASVVSPAMVTAHSLTLIGLSPATAYHYRVASQAAAGGPLNSGDFALTTANVADRTAPTVTSTTPAAGGRGAGAATAVSATFSEAMNAASITTASLVLRNPSNVAVGATVTYNPSTRVATLTPSTALAATTTYAATIAGGAAGVKDAAGNALAVNFVWSFTTAAAGSAVSIWSTAASPTAFETSDRYPVELGLKFRSDVNGRVTGVRFYKGPTTTGIHTGTLWSSNGTQLATATFTGETASGWQTVTFAAPVSIARNTTYVVSYHTDVGNYANTPNQFRTAGVDNPPLHALATANGVYVYGARAFPNRTYNATNYWVDVLFVPE